MNSRRLMGFTSPAENHLLESLIRSSGDSYAPHRSKECTPMSALGQKQTYALQQAMSALPPIATAKADSRKGHVRFTPKSRHVHRNRRCPLWANIGHVKCGEYDLERERTRLVNVSSVLLARPPSSSAGSILPKGLLSPQPFFFFTSPRNPSIANRRAARI